MKEPIKQPTVKQRKWALAVIEGKSRVEAARLAGYGNAPDAAYYNSRSPLLRKYVRGLMQEAGVSDAVIVAKIRQGMDATRTAALRVLGEDGKYTTELVQEPDHMAQAKFTEMAVNLSCLLVPSSGQSQSPSSGTSREQALVPDSLLSLTGRELQDAMMRRAQMRVAGTLGPDGHDSDRTPEK